MHFDLINFFHLVSVISFYKKHMAAWLYLDKEQFLCSIKKKNSENWFQSREIMGVRWRAMGDLSTPCWCQDCWAELSAVLSPVPPLQWWHGGVLSGGLTTLSPRGLHRHAHLKAKCLLDRGQAATACNGKEDRHLFSAVSAKGIQKWSLEKSFSNEKFKGNEPSSQPICGLYFHQNYSCNKCLSYIH